jgi:hypothetical protein
MTKEFLLVDGMHGMGDNLHQRGILRQLMREHDVWLISSWASLYHDLIADGLHVIRRPVRLRTQMKNQVRESELKLFTNKTPARGQSIRLMYGANGIMRTPSQTVLEAMTLCAPGCTYEAADYRLPVPDAWREPARLLLARINPEGKPVLIYRPLTARPEWRGGEKRNADPGVYSELFATIRDRFFVISVADLEPGKEWIIGPHLIADKELHNGELSFEHLAGLFAVADLVFTSGGFAAILGPAVGTPVISILGGYERAAWCASGARFAPYLAIEPINPCQCATSICSKQCQKQTDIPAARSKILSFVGSLAFSANAEKRPTTEMFTPEPPPPPVNEQHNRLMRAMYPKGLKA